MSVKKKKKKRKKLRKVSDHSYRPIGSVALKLVQNVEL